MHLALDSQDLPPGEVERRFRWARRRGNPAWLWPEVAIDDWRAALGQIEAAVRTILSLQAAVARLDGDPAAIGLAGYTAGVGPLLGWWSEQGRLTTSPAVAAMLDLHLRHNRTRALRMEVAAVALVEALALRGVTVVVLKGAHTARAYFPDPGVRPASDIDLLVHAVDAKVAEAVMRAEGFILHDRGPRETNWRPAGAPAAPRSLRLAHADDPWSVDLHSALDQFVSAGAPLARLDAAQPMASRRPWTPLPRAAVLDQPLLLLHLAVHAGSGLHSLTLLRLVELNLVIRQDLAAGALSWDAFVAVGEQTGSLGYAYPALRLSAQLAPGPVPAWVLDRCASRAPASVLRVVAKLTPTSAQRVERSSLAEHFMWSSGWNGRLRQFAADLAPAAGSWRKLLSIYELRAWRLLRGGFSR